MLKINTFVIAALGGAALCGCAAARYPILPTWSPATGAAMSCSDLKTELEKAVTVQAQISDIAAGRGDGVRPTLYSTARGDADRAAERRIGEIRALQLSKACSN